jgi:vacuolar-type H+-ATPase catalytic subunit A/Vma1
MTEQKKPLKIEFAPGAFDNFDGTQEELDEIMAEIHRMFASGEFMENSRPLDIDALFEEEPEVAQKIVDSLSNMDSEEDPRKLH